MENVYAVLPSPCIYINLRVRYDQILPKLHDRIKSFIKRHHILIKIEILTLRSENVAKMAKPDNLS
jgi:hypothetical protein